MNIQINTDKCFLCGKKIMHDKKEKHHSIPKCLKPKFNVIIPLCRKCHETINKLYVSQQRKDPNIKFKNTLQDAITKLNDIKDKIKLGEGVK